MPRRYGRFIRRTNRPSVRRNFLKSRTNIRRRRFFRKAVRKIAKRVIWKQTETKYVIGGHYGNVLWSAGSYGGVTFDFTPTITEGTERDQRVGLKIQGLGFYFKIRISRQTTANYAANSQLPGDGDFRFVLWTPKTVDLAADKTELWDEGTLTWTANDQANAFINTKYADVIMDVRLSLGYSGWIWGQAEGGQVVPSGKSSTLFSKRIPFKKIFTYEKDTSAIIRAPRNILYGIMINNDGTVNTQYSYTIATKFYYKDI